MLEYDRNVWLVLFGDMDVAVVGVQWLADDVGFRKWLGDVVVVDFKDYMWYVWAIKVQNFFEECLVVSR